MRPYRTASMGGLLTLLAADRRTSECGDPTYAIPAAKRVRALQREIARRQGERA